MWYPDETNNTNNTESAPLVTDVRAVIEQAYADDDQPIHFAIDASTVIGQLLADLHARFWQAPTRCVPYPTILPYLFVQSNDSQEQEES